MLGNSRTLKIHVLTSTLDKYEERLRDFLQNNNFEIIDIKICNVGLDISVLIIYRDLVQHPSNFKKSL
jgi:maleate cis-trans isomerase